MSFLSEIPLIGGALGTVIPFLLLLGIVVFVHEYGHYIVGRWCGIGAETFSVGFGKVLYSWTDKRGTKWQIAILPLGGFVKFVGDMDPASARKTDDGLTPEQKKQAFHNAPLYKRALTVLAGPVANFILSIAIFAIVAMAIGRPTGEPVVGSVHEDVRANLPFEAGDRILSIGDREVSAWRDVTFALEQTDGAVTPATILRDGSEQVIDVLYQNEPIVDQIVPGRPAAQSGMVPGDIILAVNEEKVNSFHQLRIITSNLALNTEIDVLVERDGAERTFSFVPDVVKRAHPVTGEEVDQATMGISSSQLSLLDQKRGTMWPLEALQYGVFTTIGVITNSVNFLSDMIFENADTRMLGGPIGIAQVSASQAEEGISEFIFLIGVISTSIGFLNLFPIPILDGGHLMFYLAEAVRGKPIEERWMSAAMVIGLSLVLLLMVFATYNDITRLLS